MLRWNPGEHAEPHSTAGWQRLHWWKGHCTPRTSRAPTLHLLPLMPLRKWMHLKRTWLWEPTAELWPTLIGTADWHSRPSWMVLCASAASQMLWQRAETLTAPSSRLCRPRWDDPMIITKTFTSPMSMNWTVDQCYLTKLGLPPHPPHFEKELHLNTKTIEKCLKTWRFKFGLRINED